MPTPNSSLVGINEQESPATERFNIANQPLVARSTFSSDADTPFPRTEIVECLVKRNANDTDQFPKPGHQFLGFQIIEELGRGAFGRVYLAMQGNLGGRPVALKVARDIFDESQTLAQLQHSHIVPIYSFHTQGSLQAVCMPYFGRTTLADVLVRINDRVKLPHSGRELKSTVNRNAAETIPSSHSSTGTNSLPSMAPAPVVSKTPAPAPDGWDRLEGLSFVEAVLLLGSQLADGLSHAHRRGILHKDLKPANVLLTDDGRPMLLDFNLAEDTKVRSVTERSAAGGTLPYMSPEQLRHYIERNGILDERSDLFALGVILFELLTGRHPYPLHHGKLRDAAEAMYQDRLKPTPSLKKGNQEVPPAVEAIVGKCLAINPSDRYQHAEDLREDIERHLAHRPLKFARNTSAKELLKKWVRRHPQLTSSASITTIAAVMLVGVIGTTWTAIDRARNLDARAKFIDHRSQFADAQLYLDDRNQSRSQHDEGLNRLRTVLDQYGVAEGESWLKTETVKRLSAGDRDQLRADMGEAYFRMAEVECLKAFGSPRGADQSQLISQSERWNEMANRLAGGRIPGAIQSLQSVLSALREKKPILPSTTGDSNSARDLALIGGQLAKVGRHKEALAALQKATQLDPKDFSAWFVRGTVHLSLEQNEMAAMSFGACLAIRPDFAPAWRNRGLAFSRIRFFDQAIDDYDRAIALDPDSTETYLQRASARDNCGNLAGAEADYTAGMKLESAPVRVFFLRADVRDRLGNKSSAKADREEGLRRIPSDELSWVGRAELRIEADPTAALADVEEALALNPFSLPGLQMKAHILGERLKRGPEAMTVLNRAVELFPDSAPIRAGRGVLHARQGNRTAALTDAKDAVLLDAKAPNLYQVGCIYALTVRSHPEDKTEALRYLWSGLKAGFGIDIVDTDTDLDLIRTDPEFKRMVEKARAIHSVSKATAN